MSIEKKTASVGSVIDLLSAMIQDGQLSSDSPLVIGVVEQGTIMLYNFNDVLTTAKVMDEPSMAICVSTSGVQHVGKAPNAPQFS
jgi:hypothetical protein